MKWKTLNCVVGDQYNWKSEKELAFVAAPAE